MRQKGLIVKTALKFGAEYRVYEKGKSIGKVISNTNVNYFGNNNNGYLDNATYLFNDGSYVMVLRFVETSSNIAPSNTKYVSKSISTGGKYAGKEVNVIVKTDETSTRKLIFEYEK